MSLANESTAMDVNAGLDFERARARLNQAAGEAFRHYITLKNDSDSTDEQVRTARASYTEANDDYRSLRRTDTDAIARVLGGAR